MKTAILLSTYNGSLYINEFLESLLCQSNIDFDLFVRDDFSQDNTLDIIKSYTEKINIIIIESTGRVGAAESFLTLLNLVPDEYEFYMFADQDDYWMSDKIQHAVTFLSKYKDISALYSARLEIVNSELAHLGYSRLPRLLGFRNAVVECVATGCATAFNMPAKKILTRCRPNDFFMHDWWTYLVVSAFGDVVYDERPAIKYRQHSENVVGAAHGIFGLYFNRLKRLFCGKNNGIFFISAQANELLKCYGDMLDSSKADFLKLIVEGKKSFLKRIRLVFSCGFRRQSLADDILLRFMILLNMY